MLALATLGASVVLAAAAALPDGAGGAAADALIQQGPLPFPNDGAGNAELGWSATLSADGTTALLGGKEDASEVGAAWVFTRSGDTWTQQGPKLTASDEVGGALFGASVALSADGSTALVGGPSDDHGKGALWVFTRAGGTWTQQGPKLTGGEDLGETVSLSEDGSIALGNCGNAACVFTRSGSTWAAGPELTPSQGSGSAPWVGSAALSASGSTAVLGGSDAAGGAAWVFVRSGAGWAQESGRLSGSGQLGDAEFGGRVALSADGNTALISGVNDGEDDRGSAGAAWVFVRSGTTWAQQGGKLTGSDGSGWPAFGASVALSADGETALIGGPVDDFGRGAAWVFTRSGAAWTQQGAKLVAGDLAADDDSFRGFGFGVALSADGSTALVGSPDEHDRLGVGRVFLRSGASWAQLPAKLTARDEAGGFDLAFGRSVALSADGDTALVGGPGDDVSAGAAWVFVRSGTTWTQQGPKLTGGGEIGHANVGDVVALSGDGNTALVGAPDDDGGKGAVWVFVRSGATWSPQGGKLTGTGAFGSSLALSADGSTALVGAPGDVGGVGGVWVFTRSGSTWTQHGGKLTGGGEAGTGAFGEGVALSADGSTALIGGQADDGQKGAAWVFSRSGADWSQQGSKLTGDGESGAGRFGEGVALSADGSTALVGGPGDGGGPGAVWAFGRSGDGWVQQGAKVSGISGFGARVALAADGSTGLVGNVGSVKPPGLEGAWTVARSGQTWAVQGPKLRSGFSESAVVPVALSSDATTALVGGLGPALYTVPAPAAPADVAAAAMNGRAEVSFTAPAGPVSSFTVTASPGGATATGSASPIVVAGLSNGTAYTFSVTASNAGGTSAPSEPSEPVVPVSVSGRPEPPPEPPAEAPRPAPPEPPAPGTRVPVPARTPLGEAED